MPIGMPKVRHWATTAALSVCLVAVVAVLAVLQWRWLDEVESAEHNRRDGRIRFAASTFKEIFDREIETAAMWVAVGEGTHTPPAAELARRLEAWRAWSRWPELIAEVYVVDSGEPGGELVLARLDPEGETLEPATWPAALEPARLAGPRASRRLDPKALLDPDASSHSRGPVRFDVLAAVPAILGPPSAEGSSVLLLLDQAYLAERMFPELVELLFPPPQFFGAEVAVVETNGGRVVFSNLDIEHASQFGLADRVVGLVREGAESLDIWEVPPLLRPGTSGPRPGVSLVPPSWSRQPTDEDEVWFGGLWSWVGYTGHWRLLVRSGDHPLVAQAATDKVRRATAAGALLALLATGIALLTVATRRTQRAAREQMEQIARVSHELRTPLAVLASAGDNLADGVARSPAKTRQYGVVIQKETRRLLEMVENVLFFARRRARAQQSAPQLIDLVELVAGALEAATPTLEEARVTVERDLPARRIEIEGQALGLRSAVLNLISNGIKHGAEGRWLRLAVGDDASSEARVVVEDRGRGIPDHELPRIFEPYRRGARAESDQTEGSGLGLAVVKEVVEAHGGRVSVTRPAAGGTAFTLHLPLAGAP